ncbi:hypothetical protein TNCV_1560261 [Trichonephila clavipes]|nr:hypothetical protein TNCV_1560261 [Trichonephila clavipes]
MTTAQIRHEVIQHKEENQTGIKEFSLAEFINQTDSRKEMRYTEKILKCGQNTTSVVGRPRNIKNLFIEMKAEHYVIEPAANRRIKIVIKGFPANTDVADLKEKVLAVDIIVQNSRPKPTPDIHDRNPAL